MPPKLRGGPGHEFRDNQRELWSPYRKWKQGKGLKDALSRRDAKTEEKEKLFKDVGGPHGDQRKFPTKERGLLQGEEG